MMHVHEGQEQQEDQLREDLKGEEDKNEEGEGADEQYTFPYGTQDASAFGTYMEPNQYSNLITSGAISDQITPIDPVGTFVPPINIDPRMMKLLQNSGGYGAVIGPVNMKGQRVQTSRERRTPSPGCKGQRPRSS